MKVDIGGKQFEVGQPNELSAKILKLIQDEAGTPLEAMAAIEMARTGLDNINRGMQMERGLDIEVIDKELEEGWRLGKQLCEILYRSVRD